jgi:diguanylate cyclase (GGDEF)-like protein/putative nucleotidyltransferase with HDIG domain
MKSLTLRTQLYIYATHLAGIVIAALQINDLDLSNPWLLGVLCVLASLALILKVEGATNRSHYTFSFLVYGFAFAIYGSAEAILVIVVSNLVEWIWNKPAWYIQLFNTGSYTLVMAAAGLAAAWINPTNSPNTWQTALAILVGMAVFNLLNHLMVAIVVWFARGQNFKESGIFDFFPLMLDLTLLYFGASLSVVWNYNPYALGLFAIPLYLIYNTLRVPALERQTEIDAKTGLFNHAYFKKHLSNELARSNRFDRPLSVILADLDLLRNINNTYGHLAGDEVLIGMAKAMKASVRDYDVVCRFGGEEFAILLPETTLPQAFERAETLRKAIESLEFTVPTSVTPIRATMSFGIAQRENFSQTPDEITHNADLALYHSKLTGRNRSYAYVNAEYVDFQTIDGQISLSKKAGPEAHEEAVKPTSQQQMTEAPELRAAEVTAATPPLADQTVPAESESPRKQMKTKKPNHAVDIFIGMLALVSLLSFMTILRWMPFAGINESFDWFGLMAIAFLIIMSEGFSIDLYIGQTSVSTSAIPILVAYLIFGTTGVVVGSLVIATALLLKYRSPFNRFVFNLSNHILAGSLSLVFVVVVGNDFMDLAPVYQIALSLISAAILYFTTSWMVAFGMSLDLKQPAKQIWREQYRWLAPYYLGIGFIAYALIFGYRHDHIIGLLLMVIPMILLRVSQKQYIERTRQIVTELRDKNQVLKKNSDEIVELNEGLLTTLSEIIDLRDPYVLGHSKQVSKYAVSISKIMGLNDKQIDLIRKAGLLHDIGKLGISMDILTKPGKLTPDEYETIKEHAALGGDLVKNSPSLRSLAAIIRHHHEYYNGQGYPDNIAGNQISIESRIISVADAIEAMTSDRPYRKALKHEQVLEEIKKHSGSQFDPTVVAAALTMLSKEFGGQRIASEQTDIQLRVSEKFALQTQSL